MRMPPERRAWRGALLRRMFMRVRRAPIRRVALTLAAAYVAMQRKRRLTQARFPHLDQPDVFVEDNRIKIFSYGAALYEAMYEAIDAAQERIFIESYIWKADAVGEEFKRRLLRKAREGVEVYVIFDEFGN